MVTIFAGRGLTSISRLLSLVLPFTAGALLHALEGICQQPVLPATALIALTLVQPSAVSAGTALLQYASVMIMMNMTRTAHGVTAAHLSLASLVMSTVPKHYQCCYRQQLLMY